MGTRTKTNSRKRDILVEQRDNARALAARLFLNDGVPVIDQELRNEDVGSLAAWAKRFFPNSTKASR